MTQPPGDQDSSRLAPTADKPQSDCLAPTPRSKLRRRPERGVVENILDEALVCHVGFIDGGVPVVIPTTPWRVDRWLYLHGAANSRLIRHVASGATVCVSMALVDGLVFARSAMRHSTDYRSVVLFAQGEPVGNPADKTRALLRLIDKLSPGRAEMVRPPDANELAATGVVRLPITEGSAKIRCAPRRRPSRIAPGRYGPARRRLHCARKRWCRWAETRDLRPRRFRPG